MQIRFLFAATLLLLQVVARGSTVQIGTAEAIANSAVNFNLITSNTTNSFLTPFSFSITETFTFFDGSTLTTGPFQVSPGGSVNTDVATTIATSTSWTVLVQLPSVEFTLANGSIFVADSITTTAAGFVLPVGETLTAPIFVSSVPEPNQSLLVACSLMLFLAVRFVPGTSFLTLPQNAQPAGAALREHGRDHTRVFRD